jgi:adenylate cyclase
MQDEFDRRKQEIDRFAEGLPFFYKGDFRGAASVFSGIRETDPVARSYEAKCRDLIDHPPADWQGVWVITSK